jgi:hypothetical protein
MKKNAIIAVLTIIILSVAGISVFRIYSSQGKPSTENPATEPTPETLPQISGSVDVSVKAVQNNSVTLTVKGLDGKYSDVAYELTYESLGLIKGVNSGSNPIGITGKNEFTREIYMGTCSRNVCKPDSGVKKVSIVLEFTGTDGQKSQFSKDYDL